MLASAALGFADDWMKITHRRSLGISGRTKLFMPAPHRDRALVRGHARRPAPHRTVRFRISTPREHRLRVSGADLPGARGGHQRVNLTDGLDGLAAGCAAIVLLAYTAITFITTGQHDLALVCGCLVGACVGSCGSTRSRPAIFMGDTGSLGLGGAIAALAVMTKTEVLLLVTGGIFVVEALSVLIQVIAFQRFRKRVFLMAPVHHHFELLAWSETKIILRFWIVAAISRGDRLHALPAVDQLMRQRPPLPHGPYLVVGPARSGAAAARMLREHGEVLRWTRAGRAKRRARRACRRARATGSTLEARRLRGEEPGRAEPGAGAVAARERAFPVLGELELAWRLLGNRFVAVTGTNGKTTTVELLGGDPARPATLPVAVAGNVGTPLATLVGELVPAPPWCARRRAFSPRTPMRSRPRSPCC